MLRFENNVFSFDDKLAMFYKTGGIRRNHCERANIIGKDSRRI